MLHYTSGTTGQPKGAQHVHNSIISQYLTAKWVLDLRPDDISWCNADPGWVTGTSYGIIGPWVNGITQVVVFVDDSHATGFIGRTGRGTHEHCGVFGKVDVITTTLGKALGGASGGCFSGRRELVEMCRQRARPYLFSNAVAPIIVAGALKVLELISASTERRDKLEWNSRYWRGLLTDAGFDVKQGQSPIVPVMLHNAKLAQDFARDLFDEGVYAVGE